MAMHNCEQYSPWDILQDAFIALYCAIGRIFLGSCPALRKVPPKFLHTLGGFITLVWCEPDQPIIRCREPLTAAPE